MRGQPAKKAGRLIDYTRSIIKVGPLNKKLGAELGVRTPGTRGFWSPESSAFASKAWTPRIRDDTVVMTTLDRAPHLIRESRLFESSVPTINPIGPLEYEDVYRDTVINVSRKIQIFPNAEQKRWFEKCFGAHRYYYNKCVDQDKVNNASPHPTKEGKTARTTKFEEMRTQVLIPNKSLPEGHREQCFVEIPNATRVGAIRDFTKNLKACVTNSARRNIKEFTMGLLTKKDNTSKFWMRAKSVKVDKGQLRIFTSVLKTPVRVSLRGKRLLKSLGQMPSDTYIQREKDGGYYLYVYKSQPNQHISEPKQDDIIALDPGVRTFLTGYTGSSVVEYGNDIPSTLTRHYVRIDKTKAVLLGKLKSRVRKKLKRRLTSLRSKVKNIIREFHWRVAKHLTDNYSVILLPEFRTSQMAAGDLPRPVKKSMMALSHYKFKQKLLWISQNKPQSRVIICDESYTSKTCGKCGCLNETLGSSKIFACPQCSFTMDRDWNAARNILIRSMTKYFAKQKTKGNDQPSKIPVKAGEI